jgi:hypothetical protein
MSGGAHGMAGIISGEVDLLVCANNNYDLKAKAKKAKLK